MPEGALLDTDVLLKVSAFRLADDLIEILRPIGQPGALGLAHLIAPKQLVRLRKRLADIEGAATELSKLLANIARIEPTQAEIELAAELEEAALADGHPLDRGEAQLVAALVTRGLPLLLTGDKRAIACLELVLARIGRAGACAGRVACIEQLMSAVVARLGAAAVRLRICAEHALDTSLRLCFSCAQATFNAQSACEGLRSYIDDARRNANGVLFPGDLSSLT
jgi:hypothetical protein